MTERGGPNMYPCGNSYFKILVRERLVLLATYCCQSCQWDFRRSKTGPRKPYASHFSSKSVWSYVWKAFVRSMNVHCLIVLLGSNLYAILLLWLPKYQMNSFSILTQTGLFFKIWYFVKIGLVYYKWCAKILPVFGERENCLLFHWSSAMTCLKRGLILAVSNISEKLYYIWMQVTAICHV